jgi:FKBP-type peptidyl-prolyl cis-trans isomerase
MIRQTVLAFAGAAALLASTALPSTGAAAPPQPHTADIHEITPLRYRVLAAGPAGGAHPLRSDQVVVRYTGRFADGKVFDSSKDGPDGTATFPVGRLIPGWTVALQLMRPGDHWELTVPPEMAYGAQGAGGGVIPPNATLVFDMELVSIVPPAPPAGQ